MSAIAEALVTTAVGILVALPAVAVHNALQRPVARTGAAGAALAALVAAHGAAWPRGEPAPAPGGVAGHRAAAPTLRAPPAQAAVEQ
jgi:hypothetical protein